MCTSLEDVLERYLPPKILKDIKPILYGKDHPTLDIPSSAQAIAKEHDFQIKGYKILCATEQSRPSRIVRVGAI